jgi:hypothetical protein
LSFLSLATITGLAAAAPPQQEEHRETTAAGHESLQLKGALPTNGFEKLLGRRSFVYQGELRSPKVTQHIAVKRLVASNEYNEHEFAN